MEDNPIFLPSGPRDAKVMLVGEALGATEDRKGRPFVGETGATLRSLLLDVGMPFETCYTTNVLWFRPPQNKIPLICVGKKEAGKGYPWKPIAPSRYLPWPVAERSLNRLRKEILEVNPNVIVALGNVACWALLSTTGISKIRGTTAESTLVPGKKIIPIYHPSYINRQWADRPVALADFLKAKAESAFPNIVRPQRRILIEPELWEIQQYVREHKLLSPTEPILSIDVETSHRQIKCISFAPDKSNAIVIPFWDKRKEDWCFWKQARDEALVLRWVQEICEGPRPKCFQNGLYDIQYLLEYGIRPANLAEDTMLAHHAYSPELKKDLGFLGSIYSNESAWKLMRPRGRDTDKADE